MSLSLLLQCLILTFGAGQHQHQGCECEARVLQKYAQTKAAADTLVITEIMQNPNAVADADGEWFEVFNPGATPVNMNGWTVKDADTDSHTITQDVTVPAGGYLVLGVNANQATNGGIPVDYQYSGYTLANGADEVILVRPDTTIADEVYYDGGVQWPDPTGASMELTTAAQDNNVGSNWTTATEVMASGDKGTSGSGPDAVAALLIVTEIMQNPNAVADATGEWFEVHNPGSVAVNMNGWTIRDNGTDSHVINQDLIVAGGSYVVLGISADQATNGGIAVDYQYSGFTLANGADEVVIVAGDGTVNDEVLYDGGVQWPDPTGASMELTGIALDNNIGTNWAEATNLLASGDKGTPGTAPDGSGGGNPGGGNSAPLVNAGSDRTLYYDGVTLNSTLFGTASDPNGDALTIQWTLTSGDAGLVNIASPTVAETAVSFSGTGLFTFQLQADDGSVTTTDSVVINVANRPVSNGNYNVYFGNLHAHSSYSDGNAGNNGAANGVAAAFRYARDQAGMDWYMVADHNHNTAGMAIANYHAGVNETATVNGESANFVAIYGMEWGTISAGGHVIMASDTLWGWEAGNYDVFVAKGDYDALFSQINASGTFGSLCHPGSGDFGNVLNSAYDASKDDAISMTAVKSGPAFSTATDFSDPSNSSYESYYLGMLTKGYHLGPAGDMDTHYDNWGLANEQRTAVLATGLTKAEILEALRLGRVYCTEDRNVLVDFTASYGGTAYTLSSELSINQNETVDFNVSVTDPDGEAIGTVELLSGTIGGSVSTLASSAGAVLAHTFTGSSVGTSFFLVRVIEADTQKVWTAPIWVTVNQGGGPVNQAPTANFTFATADLQATFTDGSSDSDGAVSAWAWNFGDGASSSVQNPVHNYAAGGSYSVTLTVTDNGGATATFAQTVTVTDPAPVNQAPVAGFTFATSDLAASFSDTSSDSDGTVSAWSWNFGDGATASTQNPSHTYASAGVYSVTLTVTDNQGATGSSTQSVTVTDPAPVNQAPTSSFSFSAGDLAVSFSDASSDSDGSVVAWNWNFGDGNGSTLQSPSHSYAAGGTYTVTLTVTDDLGATGISSQSITVTAPPVNQAPSAGFSVAASDLTVSFSDVSTDADGQVVAWAWSFGDSSASAAQNPVHTYAAAGTYSVTLTVTDDQGAAASSTQTVTVSAPPVSQWTVLTSDDFESGWGNYSDGGGDCQLSSRDAAWAPQGLMAVRLRDNSGAASSFYSTYGTDVTAYSQLEITFSFIANSMENGEDFFVEYWDGSSWVILTSFAMGADFDNGVFYNATVNFDSSMVNFHTNAGIRFRCDASGNSDFVYIDEVVLSAR